MGKGSKFELELARSTSSAASPPIAPPSPTAAHPAFGRGRRRRSCGVAEGSPAGRRGAGAEAGEADVIGVEFFLNGGGSRRAAVSGCATSR